MKQKKLTKLHCTYNEFLCHFKDRLLDYNPYRQQELLHQLSFNCYQRLFLGGNRTGKTFFGLRDLAFHLTGMYPKNFKGRKFTHPINAWACSVTYDVVKKNLHRRLVHSGDKSIIQPKYILDMDDVYASRLREIKIKHHNNGKFDGYSTINWKSYQEGAAAFQSIELDYILLDEEPPMEIYNECLLRLVSFDNKEQGLMLVTMTPLKGFTELTGHFMQEQIDDEEAQQDDIKYIDPEVVKNNKVYVQASWQDNPHLSQATIDLLRRSIKPHEREARENGTPCIGSGLVIQIPYSEFVIDDFAIPKEFALFCGMDFGFNPDPTAVVWYAINRETQEVFLYKEYKVKELTPDQHASYLQPMGLDWIPTGVDPQLNANSFINGDSLRSHYKRAGLNLTAVKNDIEFNLTQILEAIRLEKFKIFKSCHKTLKEISQYSRNDRGKIISRNNHLISAMFYGWQMMPRAITKIEKNYNYHYTSNKMIF